MASSASPVRKARQAELARELNVSRQSINELVAKQVIPIDAEGLIDVELARRAIEMRVHPTAKTAQAVLAAAPPPPAEPSAPDNVVGAGQFHVWRTLAERAKAEKAQLELQQMRGELVRVIDVERGARDFGAKLIAILAGVPERIASELGVDDEHRNRLRNRLREELNAAREACAKLDEDPLAS